MVFDDSSPATQRKYYSLLEQTKTKNELYNVEPSEKEAFIQLISKGLNTRRLDSLVRNLFRPTRIALLGNVICQCADREDFG